MQDDPLHFHLPTTLIVVYALFIDLTWMFLEVQFIKRAVSLKLVGNTITKLTFISLRQYLDVAS